MKHWPTIAITLMILFIACVNVARGETVYMDDLRVSPAPFALTGLEDAPPPVPNLVLFAATEQTFLGPGTWEGNYPDLDLWEGYDEVFAPQWGIELVQAHIDELENPFSALNWEYWEESVDIQYIVSDISEVPLPAAGWLFLSAVAGLFIARRRVA